MALHGDFEYVVRYILRVKRRYVYWKKTIGWGRWSYGCCLPSINAFRPVVH